VSGGCEGWDGTMALTSEKLRMLGTSWPESSVKEIEVENRSSAIRSTLARFIRLLRIMRSVWGRPTQ